MSWLCSIRPAAELPIPRLVLSFPSPPIGQERCPSPAQNSPYGWWYLVLLCWAWSAYLSLACCAFVVFWKPLLTSASGDRSSSTQHCGRPSYPDTLWWWSRSYASVWNEDASRWSCVHPSASTWCSSLSVRTQSTEPVEARHWSCISQSHVCPWPRAPCHCLFLSSHWNLLSAVTYLYEGFHWAHLPVVWRRPPSFHLGLSLLERIRW